MGRIDKAAAWAARRVPAPLRRGLLTASTLIPARWEEWALTRRFGAAPPPVDVPDTAVRLYIAPANYAGQAYRWARASETYLDGVGARNTATAAGFAFPADRSVPMAVHTLSRAWQRRELDAVLRFSHVIIEAERPLFPRMAAGDAFAEARSLRREGLQVAMVSHGSDLRSPSGHIARHELSPFLDPDWTEVPTLERLTRRHRQELEALHAEGVPVFVSTPDLLLDAPYATWCPVTIDPEPWRSDAPALERRRPIVVHTPTSAVIKGSRYIDAALERLATDGLIEYRRAVGLPHRQIVDLYREADIVVDQLLIGNYGAVACEAMSAGRVVVSHVDDQVRGHVRSATGRDLPIVEAGPSSLADVIAGLVANREMARGFAGRGPGFVSGLHDGKGAAAALAPFLGRPAPELTEVMA